MNASSESTDCRLDPPSVISTRSACLLQQQNVLIVEDNAEVANLTCRWILETGLYQVYCAESLERALELFSPGRYFAVLLDLHLGTSIDQGIDLAVRFRERDDNLVIAVITAYYPVFDEKLLSSVDDFLPKPLDMHLLESKLLIWAIKYSRRLALKSYIDERICSYRKSLAEIRTEEAALRELLQDILRRFEIGGTNGC